MPTESAIQTTEQLDTIITGLNQLNTYIGVIIYIAGIIISFFLARFVWRFVFKPILKDYIKFPI